MTAATVTAESWTVANQRYLAAHLDRVRRAVERHMADEQAAAAHQADDSCDALDWPAQQPAPPALERVREAFGLSPFERDVLVLCAGVELDAAVAAACAACAGDGAGHPTFGLALAALPDAHWSALAPDAPLRYWRLVDVAAGDTLTRSRLAIDERVLHHLAGVDTRDERADGLLATLAPPAEAPCGETAELVERLAHSFVTGDGVVVEVESTGAGDELELAAFVARRLGGHAACLRAADVPAAAADREALARLCEREALLAGTVGVVDGRDPPGDLAHVAAFVDRLRSPVIVATADPLPTRSAPIRVRVPPPDHTAQRDRWAAALGPSVDGDELERALAQFAVGDADVAAAAAQVRSGASVWDALRAQSRPRLAGLAQRIEPAAGWEQLVLPPAQRRMLAALAGQVRHRATVHHAWGWSRETRGLGATALFAGPSGTGKTMAAEVVAGDLGLDLYRIDLSAVVSKYIGETEKNLRRVFDAAEAGGAVLLFDEADALFGKRSEVRDSHDRYANIEVSYLLQRMEAYRGLAILTTNQRKALDDAFLRRLRFVITFPTPDAEARAEIWRQVFPPETPTNGLDPQRLAAMSLTGGSIRSIALNAAFLAAGAGEAVTSHHVVAAARMEYAKLDRTLSDAEIGSST